MKKTKKAARKRGFFLLDIGAVLQDNFQMTFLFFLNSFLLGIALAVDAFSVSIVNGLGEPKMSLARTSEIAGVYAAFQFAMPLVGWICVRTILMIFTSLQKFIPGIAFVLLTYIGIKMILEVAKNKHDENNSEECILSLTTLLLQGVATSIDALSVGFAIAEYDFFVAFVSALIIAVVTFSLCFCGLKIGKKIGERFSARAQIFGGIILILIGIEIFIRGIFSI